MQTRAEQPSDAALSQDLQGFGQLSYMFPALFLTAAGMATFVLLNRLVQSQRAQIGTLRANGFSKRTVFRHELSYGLVIGIAGSVIGLVIGVPLGFAITGAYTDFVGVPDTVRAFQPATIVVGLAFGVAMGALSALVPARAAARLSPAEAMRGDVPSGGGRPSLAERLLPPLRRLPVRWRMALRGIGRNPRRSTSTVLGVVLSLVLVLVSWGMIDSTTAIIDRQFDDIQHQDAQVVTTVPVDDQVVAQLADATGVARAEPVLALGATLSTGGDAQYATQVQAFEPGTQMHSFLTGSGPTDLPAEGLLLGQGVTSVLDVGVGDQVTMAVPSLGTSITTTVAGFVDEPLGTYAYASRPWLTQALEAAQPPATAEELASPAATSVMVTFAPGATAADVRATLTGRSDVAAVSTADAIQALVNDSLALFYGFVGIMLAFGAAMAFALMFNMLSVTVAERSVEFATLRANGLSVRQIDRLLTGENLLLTVIGVPVGLVLGTLLGRVFLASYTSDLFTFSLTILPLTYVVCAVAIVAVALLSEVPARRAIARLDVARVVRERAV